MMLKTILALSLFCSVAFAQDMESILSEADKAPTTKGNKASETGDMSAFEKNLRRAVGKWNSERSIFVRFFESSDWEKATLQFPKAFENTDFENSNHGKALFGLIQFKAGLPVTGIETLFMAGNPKTIPDTLREEWAKLVPVDHFVWDLAKVRWSQAWTEVFNAEIEYYIKARETGALSSTEELKKLASLAPAGGKAQSEIQWRLALAYALADKSTEAAKVLAQVMKNTEKPVSMDLMNLTAARMLFQNGYFDAAVKYYEKVSKNSEHWVEAQEEIAWSYIRKGEPQNAIAVTRGLTGDTFKTQVRAETFFVDSLSHLKICDYPSVVKTLEAFPKNFKERTKALEALTKSQTTPAANKAIDLLKVQKISFQDLGTEANSLPRLLVRDDRVRDYAKAAFYFDQEAARASELYAKSLALTGLQGYFENLQKRFQEKANASQTAALSRVKELAATEVFETKEILRKMHIVEAEVIQQVAMADTLAKNSASADVSVKKGSTGGKSAETLKFPADDETWFDEIGSYKVDVKKACHAKR